MSKYLALRSIISLAFCHLSSSKHSLNVVKVLCTFTFYWFSLFIDCSSCIFLILFPVIIVFKGYISLLFSTKPMYTFQHLYSIDTSGSVYTAYIFNKALYTSFPKFILYGVIFLKCLYVILIIRIINRL